MFRGRLDCKIDDKGRMNLPTLYRESLPKKQSQRFVITNGLFQGQACLDVYSWSEWEKLEARIQKLPQLRSEVQAYRRFYLSAGQVTDLDKSGRLLIPLSLRKHAALKEEVVLVGMGEKFEIWSLDSWDTLHRGMLDQYESILGVVAELEESKK